MALVNLNPNTVPGLRMVDGGDTAAMARLLNIPTTKRTTNVASGATTAAQGDLTGGGTVFAVYSAVGAAALTTRTAAQMLADMGNLPVGYTWTLVLINTSGGTTTFTAGTGVTINGTATLATATTRTFIGSIDSSTAISFTSVGTGTP